MNDLKLYTFSNLALFSIKLHSIMLLQVRVRGRLALLSKALILDIHITMEYYSALKKNEILLFAATLMDLKIIKLK